MVQFRVTSETTRRMGHGLHGWMRNAALVMCSVIALDMFPQSLGQPAQAPPLEYQVKAAFLLNFTKFVEWPETAFTAPDAPIVICILGEDPFGGALDQLVEGEAVNGRKLVVERIRRTPPESCKVLFAGKPEKDVAKLLGSIGPGVLTVGEEKDFLRDGGMIAFVIDDRRVRFDINLGAAAKGSLRIRSRLLSVARSVEK